MKRFELCVVLNYYITSVYFYLKYKQPHIFLQILRFMMDHNMSEKRLKVLADYIVQMVICCLLFVYFVILESL